MSGSIGVLLPARLETRFDQRDDGSWRLRIIVIPGEASFDVHDPVVRVDELDRLEAAAAACGGQLAGEDGAGAFESLAQEIGAGRAAWLVRTRLRTTLDGWSVDRDGAVARGDTEPAPAVIRGLPDALQIWAETPTGDVLLQTLEPRHPRPDGLHVSPRRTDLPADERPEVFWASWSLLVRTGLAGTVDLTELGVAPGDIGRLVVVGVGAAPAGPLFAAHVDAGNAALLRPGTPTNVTAGSGGHPQPTASDHHAVLPTESHDLVPPGRTASADLARALTGAVDGLPRLVGGDVDHRGVQHAVVQTVWPALWGHAAQDLWGPGDRWPAFELAWWVGEHLLPQGPLATLLIDDQPYGVLPLTPLESAGGGHPVEERLAPALDEALRSVAGLASEDRDTVVGADSERLLRVLGRTPTSRGYAWRWSLPVAALAEPAVADTQAATVAPYLHAAGHDASVAAAPPVAVGNRHPVVEANAEPHARPDDPATERQWELAMRMVEQVLAEGHPEGDELRRVLAERAKDEPVRASLGWLWNAVLQLRDDPQSLNARLEGLGDPWPDSLLFHLARLSIAELWRWGHWASEGRPGPPSWDSRTMYDVGEAWPAPVPAEAAWVMELVAPWLEALHDLTVRAYGRAGDLDRTTAAVIDAATHRLDPWAIAPAWRRLDRRDDAPRVLGLYGWVDEPFRGEPGLGDHGVTLAPSPDQAKTAAIARDRAVAHHRDGIVPDDLKDLPLDSERVRVALRVARAVRAGAHPAEALGREFERLLPSVDDVRTFRETYPAHGTDAGRRTCDGLAVAAAVTGGTLTDDTDFDPDTDLQPDVARRFRLLADVLADLGDLLVLEAIHDTVTGGAAQAAVALDAAAGLAAPPDFRFPTTPAGGVSLRTTVRVELPDVAPDHPPRVPADSCPAVAAHLDDALPDPDGAEFTWSAGDATVTLGEMGLSAADLVAVDDDTLLAEAADRLGLAPAAVTPPAGLLHARVRVDLLSRCAAAIEPETAVWSELEDRVRALRVAALDLAVELEAVDPETDVPSALARRALRWGLRGRADAAAARLRALLPAPTDDEPDPVAARITDPVSELARLGGGAGGVPGSPARRGAVLVRSEPNAQGVPVDEQWRSVFERVRPNLVGVPADWSWRRHVDDDPWTGRSDAHGAGRVADVTVGPAGAGAVVSGALDAWTETLPDRDAPVTAAFSFRTPGARAPQAILLAVPPEDGDDVDVEVARAVVHQAALLARARSVPPSRLGGVGALLPSAHLPAGERGGVKLDGLRVFDDESVSHGLHVRLEPTPADAADIDEALRAEVGDPVWMLARQWQLGEHAGANASSPVEYRLRVSQTPLRPPVGRPYADPVRLPGEVVLEAASRDLLAPDPVGGRVRDPWDPVALWHHEELRLGVPPVPVVATAHDGGVADWWSLDAGPTDAFTPVAPRRRFTGLPGRMDYPGAPEPGWFTLEDPRRTVTGHLPDPSHVASLFFLDVVAGHATDWYLARMATPRGHVARLHELSVLDSFDDVWPRAGDSWRSEADAWTTPFRTAGLGELDLVAWFATPPPLEGDVVEQVVMGIDEDADLLWVVEERIDGHDVTGPDPVAGYGIVAGGVDAADRVAGTPPLRYRTAAPSPGPWHPYVAADPTDGGPRRFRQGRLRVVDEKGRLRDGALPDRSSRFLALRRGAVLPEIDPAAVPASGLRLERRWVVARAADGRPVVWQQRRRIDPRAAPAFAVGHDRTAER